MPKSVLEFLGEFVSRTSVVSAGQSIAELAQRGQLNRRAAEILLPFVINVAAHEQWATDTRCHAVILGPSGMTQHVCSNAALDACCICGVHVCLAHAFLAADASLVCTACIQKLALQAGQRPRETPPRQARQKPAAPTPASMTPDQAWAIVGLPTSCSDSDLAKRKRELLVAWHPDKAKSASEKAKFQAQFVKIQAACEIIAKSRGKPKS